jgi:hypothetical protein
MNVMDKIKNIKRGGGFKKGSVKGIFHQFKDGDNIIRLVGEFIQVKTHFIAGAPQRKDRGLCLQDSFEGDDRIPKVINCADWDVSTEKETKEKTCVICKLNALARSMSKNSKLSAEDKIFWDKLGLSAYARTSLKWNIFDRDDPYVVQNTDEGDKKILGLKISTIGMEAWKDIEKVFHQLQFDITDAEKGVDLCVNKGSNSARVVYSANAVMDGIKVKQTPFTEEELALVAEPHDLKKICGGIVDQQKIFNALHVDYRSYLEETGVKMPGTAEEQAEGQSEGTEEPAAEPAPEPEAPKTKVSVSIPVAPKKVATATAIPAKPTAVVPAKPAVVVKTAAPAPKVKVVEPEPEPEAATEGGDDSPPNVEEFECFGTIDEKHPECKACEGKDACKVKKAELAIPKKK